MAAVKISIINCPWLVLILAPPGGFLFCYLVFQRGNTNTTEQIFTKPGWKTDPSHGQRDQSRIFLSFVKMGVFCHCF